MNIYQVVAYYPPHMGGMEQTANKISEQLFLRGHHVEVFTSNVGCEKDKLKSTNRLKINYLPAFEFAHTPIAPSLFFKLAKVNKKSIIHVHVAHSFYPEVAYMISKIRKIPYIVQIHTDAFPSGRLGILLPLYKIIFLKRIIKGASKIIVLTKDYENLIVNKYKVKRSKIVIISNSSNFNPLRSVKDTLKSPARILFIGRLSKEKNVKSIIHAIKNLIEKGYEIRLEIVGDGPEKEDLATLTNKLGISKNINFKGAVKKIKLKNIYSNSDIVVLPSFVEAFSGVLLEAMALGKPIVASDILGTRSIIKNNYNGLLVRPTPLGISNAIEKLIRNKKLRMMLAKNGLVEIKKYTEVNQINKLENLYKQVLKEHAHK